MNANARRIPGAALLIVIASVLVGDSTVLSRPASGPGDAVPAKDLILATTTSFQDSGLLDVLLERFRTSSPYRIKAIAVGSGEALRMGEQGSADVLVVHSPADEEKFMAAGHGRERRELMSNDFIIVGPAADPARIKGLAASDALRAILETNETFVSRADGSGTDKKEETLWKKAGRTPAGDRYVETGQGMAETMKIASEKSGYTLTDRGTFLAAGGRSGLVVLVEGGTELVNVYHVITIDPVLHPGVDLPGAEAFMEFLLKPETQKLIGEFGKDRFGVPLFKPASAPHKPGSGEGAWTSS